MKRPCPYCYRSVVVTRSGTLRRQPGCTSCRGTGWDPDRQDPCLRCNGTGKVKRKPAQEGASDAD